MTALTPEEATGGKVWKPFREEDIPPVSVKTKVRITVGILVWVALGVALTFWVPVIFNFALAATWHLVTLFSLLYVVLTYTSKSRSEFIVFRNSMLALSLASLALIISTVVLVLLNSDITPAPSHPANSWILEEATRLTGVEDYKLDTLKTYPEDGEHLSAVIDSPTRVDVMELNYVDGEWKAKIK